MSIWFSWKLCFLPKLNEKVSTLEHSLSHMAREFGTEKRAIVEKYRVESEASKIELVKLQRVIELKTKEMNKVKRLAKNILDQRTELERFFLDALDQVKREIGANQYVAHSIYCKLSRNKLPYRSTYFTVLVSFSSLDTPALLVLNILSLIRIVSILKNIIFMNL